MASTKKPGAEMSASEWLDSLEQRRRFTRSECLQKAADRLLEGEEIVGWVYLFAWAGMPL